MLWLRRYGGQIVSDPDALVSVYSAANVTDAHLVKNLLADGGIDGSVAGENEPFSLTITPSDVLVRQRDETRARAIIKRYDARQERRADRPDWTCPTCQATVIGAFDECDVCGCDRPGSEED
jgi:hypothetical protein